MTKKTVIQPHTLDIPPRTLAVYDLILEPTRPIDVDAVSREDLRLALDNAARRLHEVAEALDRAAEAVKEVIDVDVALEVARSGVTVADETITRLAPSAIAVMTYREAVVAVREAAEATEARAQTLRSMAPVLNTCAARRRTRGTCALRGCKRA
ncbi:hypothetical protein [Nitratidesulfovibrio sp. 1201_IL3209]|uniref:hypothetical protein n=1 Tax=Nitratidesulfovibrio sp. 1201_IL3209 TaxID=3084053 RepID=UPI002FD8D774